MAYDIPPPHTGPFWHLLRGLIIQIWENSQSAGTGTAKMRIGTRAEREAYGSAYNGLPWSEEDHDEFYKFKVSTRSWVRTGSLITDFMVTLLDDEDAATARATLDTYSTSEVDALISAPLGFRTEFAGYYKDTTHITMPGGGVLDINGTLLSLDADTDLEISTAADTNHIEYIYAENDGGSVTLSHSSTAPTRNAAKGGGWYDATGDKRWIDAVPVNSSNQVVNYVRDGRWIALDSYKILVEASSGNPTVMTALATGVPAVGRPKVRLHGQVRHTSIAYVGLYAISGDASDAKSVVNVVAAQNVVNNTAGAYFELYTDTSGQIKYAVEAADCIIKIHLHAFTVPME